MFLIVIIDIEFFRICLLLLEILWFLNCLEEFVCFWRELKEKENIFLFLEIKIIKYMVGEMIKGYS